MSDERYNELMQDELDGITTPEDSSKLREYLAQNPEAMARFEGLRNVHGMLNRVALVEPPPRLKAGVLRSIRPRDHSEPERVGWLEALAAAFGRRPIFRFAYSFAAGVAAGIIGFSVLKGDLTSVNRIGPDPFSGTMSPSPNGADFRKVDERRFEFSGGWVAIETGLTEYGVAARVKARSDREIRINLEFDPRDLGPVGLAQLPGGSGHADLARGRVELSSSGEAEYRVYIARKGAVGSPLRVAIHSQDGLSEGVLRTDKPDPGTQ